LGNETSEILGQRNNKYGRAQIIQQCLEVSLISVSFDRVAEIYDKTRSLPSDVMRKLVESLTNELGGCKTVLDIGTGTGRFAKPLQQLGFEVVGIDIAKKMIGKAREKGVNNLFLGDACLLPFKANTFDVTICIHLLHLVSKWEAALGEICRVTRSFMFSLFYANKDPVRESYDWLLKKYGYERRRLGKSEQELKNLINPPKSVFVSCYNVLADERLANLAQGTFSSQWNIPEDINQKIVEELRSQFAGKTFPQELRILMWKIDYLRACCDRVGV